MPYRIAQSFSSESLSCANLRKIKSLMSILPGNHLLTPARYGDGTYSLVRLTRAPTKLPRNIRGPFRARTKNTMTARTWDPRRCVHKSRQPLLRLSGYERSYAVSEDSDC